jgi:hypothetical protein
LVLFALLGFAIIYAEETANESKTLFYVIGLFAVCRLHSDLRSSGAHRLAGRLSDGVQVSISDAGRWDQAN